MSPQFGTIRRCDGREYLISRALLTDVTLSQSSLVYRRGCCCRYFERSCWLPVLDVVPVTETAGVGRQSSVAVVVVCTTVEQLATLRHHHDIGLLRDDVQHLVLPTNDGAGDGHVTHAPATRRRLLGDGDDAILDAVIDVVIDHDELELVKTELTQSF